MTLYNPHLLARQDLIEMFVARQPLLDELVDDLRRGGRQHHLLIGGRGTGKTTLLLRLAAAIEDDKQLAKRCIPLRFPEEQYNVSRSSDFWMNAIDALLDALERQGARAAAVSLEDAATELEPLAEDVRATRAFAILETWARQAKRLVVLLVDNLDLVLDRLAGALWELREALATDNGLVLIGASSKFLDEAIAYESPFYDFFHIHELEPLSEHDARRVVLALARRNNTPRVAEVLERDPGRFKALHVLTGGTPRTLALLHTVLALERSDSIERDLDGLLDQLTPYYKARFDDLPTQSQLIVDKVALHWHPITAAECKAATRLDLNTVSAQLSRLVKNGLLAKVALPGPSKLGFQLSERFFNIWYLMRASRRLRRRLSWFVEFLRVFYGEDDLRRRAEELVQAAPPDSLRTPAQFLAFAAAVPDEALRRRLEFRAIGMLAEQSAAAIREVMDLEGEDLHLAPVIDRVRALREIRSQLITAKVRWPRGETASSAADAILRHPTWPMAVKQRVAHIASDGNTDSLGILIPMLRTLASDLGDRLLNAISTGEVPALPDVRSRSELRQIVELAESPLRVISEHAFSAETTANPLSDELLLELLSLDPLSATYIVHIATALLVGPNWNRIRHIVLLVARHSARLELAAFVFLFGRCIACDLESEALDLFVEAGLAERWAPLHEALGAVVAGGRARLDRLAPEMRGPALALYDQLRALETPQLDEGHAPRASRPPKRKRTSKSAVAAQARPPPGGDLPGPRRSRPKRAQRLSNE